MELFLKLAALATVAALLCVVLRQREKTMAVLLSLSACVLMFLLAVRMLAPIFEVAETIRDLTGLSSAVTAPLFKVTGHRPHRAHCRRRVQRRGGASPGECRGAHGFYFGGVRRAAASHGGAGFTTGDVGGIGCGG